MRITPLAVWGRNLSPKELYQAVRLQTMFTHSHDQAIYASYLYCLAIGLLIKGYEPEEVYKRLREEA
jgi:ADP-ribosylglycohydrolase